MATATGSDLLLEAASGAYGIYAYEPEASEVTLQSATGAYGEMAGTPDASEVTLQSGTPVVQASTGTIGATGAQVGLEAPNYYDVFWDYEPDPSEVTAQSGTATIRLGDITVTPSGSEVTAASGTAGITSAALFLNPAGSQVAVELGTITVGYPATGSQLTLQSGVPFVRSRRAFRATWVDAYGYAIAWDGDSTYRIRWEDA